MHIDIIRYIQGLMGGTYHPILPDRHKKANGRGPVVIP